jgi:hypothetical protein
MLRRSAKEGEYALDLSRFLSHYEVTHSAGSSTIPTGLKKRLGKEGLFCLEQLGGKTFNHGIYRVYRGDQIEQASEVVGRVFEAVHKKVVAFAADWNGRQFGLDFTELTRGKPSVSCFDLAGPDSFCTDQSVLEFHNSVLVDQADAALATDLYRRWRRKHNGDIEPEKCVGYKVPLFLGGKDKVTNLELTDMEVYLELNAQLWSRVKDLPDGTSIDDIRIEPSQE